VEAYILARSTFQSPKYINVLYVVCFLDYLSKPCINTITTITLLLRWSRYLNIHDVHHSNHDPRGWTRTSTIFASSKIVLLLWGMTNDHYTKCGAASYLQMGNMIVVLFLSMSPPTCHRYNFRLALLSSRVGTAPHLAH